MGRTSKHHIQAHENHEEKPPPAFQIARHNVECNHVLQHHNQRNQNQQITKRFIHD
uniref:Uncharacterized protein n=1 Tax=Myoviridae sp. ctshb19 TaxID=2825194 RepID=A0A8S5UGR9_9CAUD|nr:MAG TPA: hypothetical protein [Myoviridae sp. ctshb19]